MLEKAVEDLPSLVNPELAPWSTRSASDRARIERPGVLRNRHFLRQAGRVLQGELGLLRNPPPRVDFLKGLPGQHGLLGRAGAHQVALLFNGLGEPLDFLGIIRFDSLLKIAI